MEEEIWLPIPLFEGSYECSNLGRIKSLKRKGKRNDLILGIRLDNYGYHQVYLCKAGKMYPYRVHNIVSKLFVPNPLNKPHVNHLDGNKGNQHYLNLEWCTHSENHRHAYLMGLKTIPTTKLDKSEVLCIYNSELNAKILSEKYNVTKRTIWQIKIGQTWQHVTGGNHKTKRIK